MLIPIENKILIIRDQYVILDKDLAVLYGVTTKALKQAVQRNIKRFPEDFMFELSELEFFEWRSQFVTSKEKNTDSSLNIATNLRSQIVTSSLQHGGERYRPYAFTEQGVAMLSGILRSPKAVEVNIQIMRSFVQLRRMILSNEDLRRRLDILEKQYDEQFKILFEAMRRQLAAEEDQKPLIGFTEDSNP